MNQENPDLSLELKLQAYLDGELTPAERIELERQMASNPAHQQLLAELTGTRSLLQGNETERKVDDSRAFYFSKIARQIESEAKITEHSTRISSRSWLQWAKQHFVGLSGAGVAACLALILFLTPPKAGAMDGELELASDDMGAYTYRDPQQEITMVWLYDRNSENSEFTDAVKADIQGP